MLDIKTSGFDCTNAIRQSVYRERDFQLAKYHQDMCVGAVRLRRVTDNAGRPKYACELKLKLRHAPESISAYCMNDDMDAALRRAFTGAARALRRKVSGRRERRLVAAVPAAA